MRRKALVTNLVQCGVPRQKDIRVDLMEGRTTRSGSMYVHEALPKAVGIHPYAENSVLNDGFKFWQGFFNSAPLFKIALEAISWRSCDF